MKMIAPALACILAASGSLAQPAPPPGGPHPPPPPEKGAHVRLRQGDTGVDLKCPADTPLKECADAALRLLDRLSGQKPSETPR
jgi:hypothetical protein